MHAYILYFNFNDFRPSQYFFLVSELDAPLDKQNFHFLLESHSFFYKKQMWSKLHSPNRRHYLLLACRLGKRQRARVHMFSSRLRNQASFLIISFFLPDQMTHSNEREGNEKQSILLGWPYSRFHQSRFVIVVISSYNGILAVLVVIISVLTSLKLLFFFFGY